MLRLRLLILAALCVTAASCASAPIENYHTVAEGILQRGAQPTEEGFRQLKAAGIRTVVDLRRGDRREEEACVRDLGMDYVNIPCRAESPSDHSAAQFLQIVLDARRQPVFVHCQAGRDRTGTVVAVYRIVVQGWTAQRAIDELHEHQGVVRLFLPQIPEYLEHLDASRLNAVPQTQPSVALPPG